MPRWLDTGAASRRLARATRASRSIRARSADTRSPRIPRSFVSGRRGRPRRAPPARRHPRPARQGQRREGPDVPLEGHGRGHLRRPAGHRPRSRHGGLQVPGRFRPRRHPGMSHDTASHARPDEAHLEKIRLRRGSRDGLFAESGTDGALRDRRDRARRVSPESRSRTRTTRTRELARRETRAPRRALTVPSSPLRRRAHLSPRPSRDRA